MKIPKLLRDPRLPQVEKEKDEPQKGDNDTMDTDEPSE